MHVIMANNVRDALPRSVKYLQNWGREESTRLGDALVAPVPVTIKYHTPKQHVLINPYRDANPFFHLMESMWILAGRDDGAFLDHYVKNFSKDFGTDGRIMDAYGFRWRHALPFDQLEEVISQLRNNFASRQAVLYMWGAGRADLISDHAKPCNLAVTFRVNTGVLDMTVFNRSNDLIWGCLGANAVHFPILQEYVASKIGLLMGAYYQISTNLHFYIEHYKMLQSRVKDIDGKLLHAYLWNHESYEQTQPLMELPDSFDEDLEETMVNLEAIHSGKEVYEGNIANSFLRETVLPMALAHTLYKKKNSEDAMEVIATVKAADWKRAGTEWLERHIK
jgi:thymidylate synthase